MLTLRNMGVCYGQTSVVSGLDLTLGDGEILTLVGPTGCGKSTTLRAIAGLEPLSEGSLTLAGIQIDKHRFVVPEKRGIGMVFQDFALFPHLNVEQNIGFRVKRRQPVDYWLAVLGIETLRKAMPETLSGGQKQRVALARALAHSPSLVLLDEPLSNLDAALKDSLRYVIRDALKTANVPAIWVTHDQAEALSVGDRVGIMQAGRLAQIGTPEACFREPADRFVATFLGDAAFLPGRRCGETVQTVLGKLPVSAQGGPKDSMECVDLLVRPDDIGLAPVAPGNACIDWMRYEGEQRLFGVTLDDGTALKSRQNHECTLLAGERVAASIVARHPLAMFAAQ